MNKAPLDFRKALSANTKAHTAWESLTQISQRDFISWIESAKQEKTRVRRIEVACSKLVAGKRRPCCYSIVPMELYTLLGKTPKAKTHWGTLTANERRDFTDWIEESKNSIMRKKRIEQVGTMLTAGKRRP